jgi:hypothetical protein
MISVSCLFISFAFSYAIISFFHWGTSGPHPCSPGLDSGVPRVHVGFESTVGMAAQEGAEGNGMGSARPSPRHGPSLVTACLHQAVADGHTVNKGLKMTVK